MNLTLELVRDTFQACYDPDRLAALYDRPHTPLEVATRKDGPWAHVPVCDRIWTLTRPGVLPDRTLRLFACWCATTALDAEEAAGRTVDPRSREAVRVALLYADGKATDAELSSARSAAARSAEAAVVAVVAAEAAEAVVAAEAAAAAAAAWSAAAAAWSAAAAARSGFETKALPHLITLIEKEPA